MTRRRIIIATSAALLVIGLTFTGAWIKFLFTPIVTDPQGLRYRVPAGASVKTIIKHLYAQQTTQHPFFFNLLVRMRGDAHGIKAGEYLFPMGTTPPKMLDQMISGSGMVYHAFTIVAGWNFRQLGNAMAREETLRHTSRGMSDKAIMEYLGHAGLNPEGQFFPDTYYFAEGSSDLVLLKSAFQAMQTHLNAAWQNRAKNLLFKNPQELLTVASLIEKEAYLNSERPLIAGVITNRLQKGMLLQIDPTVIYGLGSSYDGTIHKEDLLRSTPYNTYVRKGLPPTPIAMPCAESLEAAAHPEHHAYLYFVANGDGSHHFTKNLNDHHAAVAAVKKLSDWFFNTRAMRYYYLLRHALDKNPVISLKVESMIVGLKSCVNPADSNDKLKMHYISRVCDSLRWMPVQINAELFPLMRNYNG